MFEEIEKGQGITSVADIIPGEVYLAHDYHHTSISWLFRAKEVYTSTNVIYTSLLAITTSGGFKEDFSTDKQISITSGSRLCRIATEQEAIVLKNYEATGKVPNMHTIQEYYIKDLLIGYMIDDSRNITRCEWIKPLINTLWSYRTARKVDVKIGRSSSTIKVTIDHFLKISE